MVSYPKLHKKHDKCFHVFGHMFVFILTDDLPGVFKRSPSSFMLLLLLCVCFLGCDISIKPSVCVFSVCAGKFRKEVWEAGRTHPHCTNR